MYLLLRIGNIITIVVVVVIFCGDIVHAEHWGMDSISSSRVYNVRRARYSVSPVGNETFVVRTVLLGI